MPKKPTTNLTPNDQKELELRISIESSRTKRFKLEMFLSGAGGLVLSGIALRLFTRAFRSRNQKKLLRKS